MNSARSNTLWAACLLLLTILFTRTQHFGSQVYLPDATLAALFVGGLLIRSRLWLPAAIAAAFAMDAYAIGWKGVSDYCMSAGYWGLVPTYAMVWLFGRRLAKTARPLALVPYALYAWLAYSLAFLLSNAFWYGFSDKVASLGVAEFSQRVAHYYVPYTGYALLYSAVAWLVLMAFRSQLPTGRADTSHS